MNDNTTVSNFGGVTNISDSVVGNHSSLHQYGLPSLANEPQSKCDVGILTVLPTETEAVQRVLGLKSHPDHNGVLVGSGQARVIAMQTREQGLDAAAIATSRLIRDHRPRVVVLTGIGGGIHPAVRIKDVVVTTQVVGYDLRKETPAGTEHRGQGWTAPQEMAAAVNAFFSEHVISGGFPEFGVLHGPIGSGNAVIGDHDSELRNYLSQVNSKILAVDMEAGGVARCCHENAAQQWVVVRGISDNANASKNDNHQAAAAENAAVVLRQLIPYLAK